LRWEEKDDESLSEVANKRRETVAEIDYETIYDSDGQILLSSVHDDLFDLTWSMISESHPR
jgi:hypothetical protein